MSVMPVPAATPPASPELKKYFKLQLKAWTNFDPTDKRLSDIAAAIERGAGFVTVMEVTQAAELKEIGDGEVRERFESIAAAEKLMRNLDKLPKAVREQLQTALTSGEPPKPGIQSTGTKAA
jgi:hypothetical protein